MVVMPHQVGAVGRRRFNVVLDAVRGHVVGSDLLAQIGHMQFSAVRVFEVMVQPSQLAQQVFEKERDLRAFRI